MIRRRKDKLIWVRPKELPNLRGADLIGFDLETKDEGLSQGLGPGGVFGLGHILGVSVATSDGYSGYFPLRHPESNNWDVSTIKRWAKDQLTGPEPKVGANIKYDLEWWRKEGFQIKGPFYDVQIAEPLLNETRGRYNLQSLCEEHLPEKYWKASAHLDENARNVLGSFKGNAAAHLWKLPARLVGVYAEMDAVSVIKLIQLQLKRLEADDLMRVWDVETRLTPLLLDMRFQGVRVHTKRAEQLVLDFDADVEHLNRRLKKLAGKCVNVRASASIAEACDQLGIEYPQTDKGNPSFVKEWMAAHDAPFMKLVHQTRRAETARDTFLKSAILGHLHNGRLHSQFHQTKSDDYGAATGRFSSSDPNLQQVPSREATGADRIRALFIPEPREEWWKIDFSQIEYRLIVHFAEYAEMNGSTKAADAYRNDPNTDFHTWVAGLIDKPRKIAKNINFGLAYTMGAATLARALGLPLTEAYPILNTYHDEVPFVRALSNRIERHAKKTGEIKTLLGRKRRFKLFEPKGSYGKDRQEALSLELAKKTYPTEVLQRAYTYKAMNSMIQGSAADIMKMAMVQVHEAGCFAPDALGHPPSLTVHDELDGSKPKTKAAHEALRSVADIMENCIKLNVPIIADTETGKDWWNVKPFKR